MTSFHYSYQNPSNVSFFGVFLISAGSVRNLSKGGFPLPRNFPYARTTTRVNEIGTMYGRSRVYVKVEPRSTFTYTRGLSYIASISSTRVKITRQ